MDMSNVKTLFDNNVQKNVKKITDANGNILWYKVPDGYRKVEYLESSNGTSYIDTGISINKSCYYTTEIKFQLGATHRNNAGVFGTYVGGIQRYQIYGSSTNLTFGVGEGYYSQSKDDFVAIPHTAVLDAKNLNVKLDGENKQATTNSYSRPNTSSGAHICIFASYQGTVSVSENSKIWYVRIWDNDVLIRHFIPVVRNADDKPGMYDLVNGVFYTNAGTGEFTWREIDGNLFLGFDSRWCLGFSCIITSGMIGTAAYPRTTYFFACKPNTTYRYTAETAGDRFCVYTLKQLYDYPPALRSNSYPYDVSAEDMSIIENSNTAQINSTKDYTFTTGSSDRMIYLCIAREVRPTGVRIVEVES